MSNFKVITINGRMQTADAEPEIDLTAQRIALRKMPHGEVAFHDDPQSKPAKKQTLLEWADSIAESSDVLDYLVRERGGCRCFTGCAPCGACCSPITEREALDLLNQFGEKYPFDGALPDEAQSTVAAQDLADAIPAAIEHAAACVGPDGVAKFFEGYMPEQTKTAQPVALEGVVYQVIGAEEVRWKFVDGAAFSSVDAGSTWREDQLGTDLSLLSDWLKAGLIAPLHKPINVAAQASNETTAAQEQSQVSATPDADGWIAHTPGKCPVAPDVVVEVKYRAGFKSFSVLKASAWVWSEDGEGTITHYRPHKAAQELGQ